MAESRHGQTLYRRDPPKQTLVMRGYKEPSQGGRSQVLLSNPAARLSDSNLSDTYHNKIKHTPHYNELQNESPRTRHRPYVGHRGRPAPG